MSADGWDRLTAEREALSVLYSPGELAVLERLMSQHVSWVKAAWNNRERMTPLVWQMFAELLDEDMDVRPTQERPPGDGVVRSRVGEGMLAHAGGSPGFGVVLDGLPATAGTWRVLGRWSPVDHGLRRLIDVTGGAPRVELRLDYEPGEVITHLTQLETAATALRTILADEAASASEADNAEAGRLERVLTAAGVGHCFSADLLSRLQSVDPWHWTTLGEQYEQPAPVEDHLMQDPAWLLGPVRDHLTVRHTGHGVGSFTFNVRAAVGPLALHTQTSWGGGFSDGPADTGRLTEMLHRVGDLLQALPPLDELRGRRGRNVVLRWSSARAISELWAWDHDLREWSRVTSADADDPRGLFADARSVLRV